MENKKKAYKSVVCNMNQMSQINNENWSPQILQNHHKLVLF